MRKKLLVWILIFAGLLFSVVTFSHAFALEVDVLERPANLTPGQPAWRFDRQVTQVGKRAERARQFINWVLTHPSIDNHPVFRQIWLVSAITTFFLIVLTVGIMGLGLILAKKRDVSFKVDVMPILTKVALLVVYVAFSYWLVLGLIQITDVLMQFFIKLLNADDLFTIFFTSGGDSETGYKNFQGLRNYDPLLDESAKTSMFLVDLSSYTYYIMGVILIIRKIILWFLLILGPFLALLMPFRLIRNVGWIWVGVFFQWAFYGPVFALFLGALTRIWQAGIPFPFNFQRAADGEVVYPLAINILYGGPAQTEGSLGVPLSGTDPINSSSYIDTFAEYVISILMLWVVMVLPWLLLRIFRDYCCDGIDAIKNMLLNKLGSSGMPPSGPSLSQYAQKLAQKMQIPQEQVKPQEVKVSLKIENLEEIKKMTVEDIARSMDLRISSLKDIAQFETNRDKKESASKLMQYMKNPMSAGNNEERSKFMRVKTELSQRAAQGDVQAQNLLTATVTSPVAMKTKIQEIAKTRPQLVSISGQVASLAKLSEERVKNIVRTTTRFVLSNKEIVAGVSQKSKTTAQEVTSIVESVPPLLDNTHRHEITEKIVAKTGVEKAKVEAVLQEVLQSVSKENVVEAIAREENVKPSQVQQVAQDVFAVPVEKKAPAAAEVIATTPTIGIDEYEEIRKMWQEHYIKGEVPVSEDLKTRKDWVSKESIKIDNILNKLISDQEEIRAKGLEEVSDIIPFFVLGDMSMQDIATYLKAKQSAAEAVKKELETEEKLKTKLKEESEDQFVELPTQKTGAASKTMEMKMEMEIPKEAKPESQK